MLPPLHPTCGTEGEWGKSNTFFNLGKALPKGERSARVSKRVPRSYCRSLTPSCRDKQGYTCAERAPAGPPPAQGGTLQSSAFTGFLWFTDRGSCTPSSRLVWTQQVSAFQDFPLLDVWDSSERPWDWKGEMTPQIKKGRFPKAGKYHLLCHSVKGRKVSTHQLQGFLTPFSNKDWQQDLVKAEDRYEPFLPNPRNHFLIPRNACFTMWGESKGLRLRPLREMLHQLQGWD